MEFKDRVLESAEIAQLLESKKFEFLIIYGRRRVGKTELALHATKGKERLYFLATTENNLERFRKACIEFNPEAARLKADFEVLLDFIKEKAEVLIIDEFQNLIAENKNFLSTFQAAVDTSLKNSGLKLIILGSSVSIMTSKVLSYQSPLYGRKTASMKLKPVSFFDLKEFFPKASFQELVEVFGFADGIPYYLDRIEKPFWEWLGKELGAELGFIKDEADFLLRYEFDNPSTYKLIIEAIANGKTKVNEIKDFLKVQRTDISPYLKNLSEIGLVKREIPVNESQNSRNGRYYLDDNFLKFWFKFIYPNLSGIGERNFKASAIKAKYPEFLGPVFEHVCRQFIARNGKFAKIGKWWNKGTEIDIVCLDEESKHALFAECKWKEKVNAEKIAKELAAKAGKLEWHNQSRQETLAVFAKSFSKTIKELDGKKVECYSIKDLEKK